MSPYLIFAFGGILSGFVWVPAGLILAAVLRSAGEADEQTERTMYLLRLRVAEPDDEEPDRVPWEKIGL